METEWRGRDRRQIDVQARAKVRAGGPWGVVGAEGSPVPIVWPWSGDTVKRGQQFTLGTTRLRKPLPGRKLGKGPA